MNKSSINLCFRNARKTNAPVKFNGWTFTTSKEANMPRGGPMAAWDYTYTLVSPSGVRHELGKGQGSATNFAAGIIEKSNHVFGERSGLCKW